MWWSYTCCGAMWCGILLEMFWSCRALHDASHAAQAYGIDHVCVVTFITHISSLSFVRMQSNNFWQTLWSISLPSFVFRAPHVYMQQEVLSASCRISLPPSVRNATKWFEQSVCNPRAGWQTCWDDNSWRSMNYLQPGCQYWAFSDHLSLALIRSFIQRMHLPFA